MSNIYAGTLQGKLNITNTLHSDVSNNAALNSNITGNQSATGIRKIYYNNEEQEIIGRTAYITGTYQNLDDKPQINNVRLSGNKSFDDLGANSLTNMEIEELINSIV